MSPISYKPEIDGLRAIAVIAVILYHFGFATVSGGFVGVDIFFVISGYLITFQISREMSEDSFSFLKFYERRARRLFPALYVLLLVVVVLSFFVFTPDHFKRVGESLVYAALSLSNILFYTQAGYFDTDAVYKPLLHTWSLGVEEQFYLVWPLLLLVLVGKLSRLNRYLVPSALLLIACVSLGVSEQLVNSNPNAAFYLPYSRVFQFCIGALLVYLPQNITQKNWINEVVLALGLALILYSILFFNKSTNFPGVNALYPSVGAALVIVSGRSRYLGVLLSNRFSLFTGRISYSLYLYHWPLLVFYLYTGNPEIAASSQLFLIAGSYVCAYVSYQYVETPFRKKSTQDSHLNGAAFGLVCCLLLLPLMFVSSSIWGNDGWRWRLDAARGEGVEDLYHLDQLRVETLDYFDENMGSPYFEINSGKINLLVIGDSHARDVSNAMHMTLPAAEYEVGMLPFDDACIFLLSAESDLVQAPILKRCKKQARVLERSRKISQADIILVSQAWSHRSASRSGSLIEKISAIAKKKSQRIVVLGRAPDFNNFQNIATKLIKQGKTTEAVNKIARQEVQISRATELLLKTSASRGDYEFLSKTSIVCPETQCFFFGPTGSLSIWDHSHWTLRGAQLFGQQIARNLGFI